MKTIVVGPDGLKGCTKNVPSCYGGVLGTGCTCKRYESGTRKEWVAVLKDRIVTMKIEMESLLQLVDKLGEAGESIEIETDADDKPVSRRTKKGPQ